MVARSAPLSRAQAQARTREEVVAAAESLFLSIGYEATTVAEIAATAGRTQGAIYGNFAGKPALGLEVIQRRYLEQFARLAVTLEHAGSLEEKLAAIGTWWETLAGQEELTVLVAEYALAVRRSGTGQGALTSYIDLVRATIAGLVRDHLAHQEAERDIAFVEGATQAILATGTGLALGQAAGLVDGAASSRLLLDTIRLWSGRPPEVSRSP